MCCHMHCQLATHLIWRGLDARAVDGPLWMRRGTCTVPRPRPSEICGSASGVRAELAPLCGTELRPGTGTVLLGFFPLLHLC